MKFVSLVVSAMILSVGASAQPSDRAAKKEPVAKTAPKAKKQKPKLQGKKSAADQTADVITLTDEKAYQAKSSFERMLLRRIEVDAEEGERARNQRKD